MSITGQTLMVILVVGAAITVLQFQKGRRVNTNLMTIYIRGFESNLKLKDKTYVYLGGYVGFRAQYDLANKLSNRLEMTLTLLPRQSIFYFPISLLSKRSDRLYVIIRPSFKIQTDAHIVRKRYYLFGADIDEAPELEKIDTKFKDKEYYALFRRKSDIQKLTELINKCFDPDRLFHIGFVKRTNVLFCLMKPDPFKTPDEIRKLVEYFPKVVYEKEEMRAFEEEE
jgi:hypothetical protein